VSSAPSLTSSASGFGLFLRTVQTDGRDMLLSVTGIMAHRVNYASALLSPGSLQHFNGIAARVSLDQDLM
jgi:hypothetical protein